MVTDLTEAASRGAAMGRISESSAPGSMLGAMWGFTILGRKQRAKQDAPKDDLFDQWSHNSRAQDQRNG